jgi:hypothetical protein
MKLLKKLYDKINPPPQPKYGAAIFNQKTWLTRQVEDAMFLQATAHIHQTR